METKRAYSRRNLLTFRNTLLNNLRFNPAISNDVAFYTVPNFNKTLYCKFQVHIVDISSLCVIDELNATNNLVL